MLDVVDAKKTGDAETHNMLTYGQVDQLKEVMKPLCRKHPTIEGMAQYDKDWKDVTVAAHATKALGFLVTTANVAGIRKQLFGSLRQPSPKPAEPQLPLPKPAAEAASGAAAGTIGWAVSQLNLNLRVKRSVWKEGFYLRKVQYAVDGQSAVPCIVQHFPNGAVSMGWSCNNIDLLAPDWELV